MPVGLLTLHMQIPGCASLKEKRSHIKPLLARLHREFNVSTAEMGLQDVWDETLITCAWVGNDPVHIQRSLQTIIGWLGQNWPDLDLINDQIEII